MSEPRRTTPSRLVPLCLVLLTFIVFVNGVTTPFVFDDRMVFESGSSIRSFENAWLSGPTRRVGMLSFAANFRVHGLRPVGFHVVNIAIHAAAALVLYGLMRRTLRLPGTPEWLTRRTDEVSVLTAAIWAIHPLQTESVTYTVQRFESLAGLFMLVSLYALLRGATSDRRWPWYVLSVLASALAAQTKETAFSLPLLTIVFDRIFLSSTWRDLLRRRGLWHGLHAVVAVWLIIQVRWAFDPSQSSSIGIGIRGLSSWEYLRSEAGVILHYLRLAVFPDTLCLDYAWPVARSFWRIYPQGLVVVLLLVLTFWGLARRPGPAFLGWAFFVLLAPTSSFVPIVDLAFEHRMYLALAPVVALAVLAATWVVDRLATRAARLRYSLLIALTLIVVAYGTRTVLRNRDYREPMKLWKQAIAVNPRHTRAYTWIGMCHFEQGDDESAIRNYREALRIHPGNWLAWLNLGVSHMRRREDEQAIRCFRNCLDIRPGYSVAYQNYGTLLLRQGRTEQAIQAYRWAIHYNPRDARHWSSLGMAYRRAGNTARAEATFARARQIDPRAGSVRQLEAELRRWETGVAEPASGSLTSGAQGPPVGKSSN